MANVAEQVISLQESAEAVTRSLRSVIVLDVRNVDELPVFLLTVKPGTTSIAEMEGLDARSVVGCQDLLIVCVGRGEHFGFNIMHMLQL